MLVAAPHVAAHDVPDEVRVHAFVKPEGRTLRLLVRVPLAAMRDVDVPQKPGGLLDLARADAALRMSAELWLADAIEITADDVRLGKPRVAAARVSLPSDRSFVSYEQALAHLGGPPLAPDTQIAWNQGLLDAALEYPIASDAAAFAIRPRLERLGLRVAVALRFVPPKGESRAFELHGDPGLVPLDPAWTQAASGFVARGVRHILEGTDHLLFLVLLVAPFRRFWTLAAIATAFTAAHSVTLLAAAFGLGPDARWFPPLVEAAIAASILWMAVENAFGGSLRRRWMLAFAFGLVHGFGFSFGLQEQLQFAGAHLASSLVAFNVGVELGQLAALAVLVPLLSVLMRPATERAATILLSLVVGHVAWHWLAERAEALAKFPLPPMDLSTLAAAMRWLAALVAVAALLWLADAALARRARK